MTKIVSDLKNSRKYSNQSAKILIKIQLYSVEDIASGFIHAVIWKLRPSLKKLTLFEAYNF